MTPLRTKEKLNSIIKSFLKRKGLLKEDAPWEIRESSLGGFGIFARRDIEAGEIIFLDFPIIFGPRCQEIALEICLICFSEPYQDQSSSLYDYRSTIVRMPPRIGCAVDKTLEWGRSSIALPVVCSDSSRSLSHFYSRFLSFAHLRGILTLVDLNSNLSKCAKNCGLLLCPTCQNSAEHTPDCTLIQKYKNGHDLESRTAEVTRCLTPLRSLLLSKEDAEVVSNLKYHTGRQHGHEVQVMTNVLRLGLMEDVQDFLRFVCSVMDANAFEVDAGNGENRVSMRGLYPLGSLANHRCYPNAFHVFDDNRRMVVRASVFIERDEEIFHSYLRLIWGTTTRMFHLKKTKHFVCSCNRCVDPTEFGTYMGAISCERCRGNVIPINPLKKSPWQCQDCHKIVPPPDVARVLSLVGAVLKTLNDNDFKYMHSFLTKKLTSMVPEYSEVIVELKYRMIWILGYKEGYLWKDLPLELLELKKEYCRNILDLLKKLKIGQCHIRGLLLYETYLCIEEIKLRQNNNTTGVSNDVPCIYLEEAADILRYSTSAPKIIKEKWRSNK